MKVSTLALDACAFKCAFGSKLKKLAYFIIQLIFATIHGSTVLFGTIYKPHCTISVNVYLYSQYFQQKIFNFSKISDSSIDP